MREGNTEIDVPIGAADKVIRTVMDLMWCKGSFVKKSKAAGPAVMRGP